MTEIDAAAAILRKRDTDNSRTVTPAQPAPVIEIGNINVDTVGKRVLLDGQVVELTAVEYGLMELLALHRGRVVLRSMIYEHLFDENHDSLSNMVDV